MKKLVIGALLLSYAFFAQAQKLVIKDTVIVDDKQRKAAIYVQLEPQPDWVKSGLKKWMKKEKDVKLKGYGFWDKDDKLTAKEVTIESVSSMTMDFAAEVLEKGNGSEMFVFGSFGYSVHVSPENYKMEYRGLKAMTLDFLGDLLPGYYQKNIEDMESFSGDLEKERENMREEIEENTEEIVELKEENVELEEETEKTIETITETAENLQEEKAKLEAVNKKLKSLESGRLNARNYK